jgi:flagellar biosynthesis repressor protein FlbT
MALKISLKPGEKFVVNGAVITNGERRSSFVIQNKVSILRERDILTPDQVDSPAKRVYFPIMLSYLDPDKVSDYYQEFVERMSELMTVLITPDAKLLCVQISMDMMARDFYKALAGCRKLVEYEAKLIGASDGLGGVPKNPESSGVAA